MEVRESEQEKLFFIVNTASKTGKAKQTWEELKEVLERRQVSYQAYTTQYCGHATELAKQICDEPGRIHLIVMGGDGTVNEVLNGMHDLDRVTFGCIPSGSANDFARGAGLKGSPAEILERMLDAPGEVYLDCGKATYGEGESRRFIVSAGVGVDADVCRQALDSPVKKFLNRLHLGQLTYVVLTVKTLFTMPLVDAKIRTQDGQERHLKKAIFLSAMNLPYEGGGVPMAPKASPYDGKLSCCCVYGIPRIFCFFLLPVLCVGKHEGIRGISIINSSRLEVTLRDDLCIHTDGEFCGRKRRVVFEAEPKNLRMKDIFR